MTEFRVHGDEELGRLGDLPEEGSSFERGLVVAAVPAGVDDVEDTYLVIEDECARLGLRASRADAGDAEGPALGRVTNLIRRAEFLVFDLTDEQPSVLYGLGYAHGVGNEVPDILLLAREGWPLSFDLAPLPVQRYRSPDHLRAVVFTALQEMMQQTRR